MYIYCIYNDILGVCFQITSSHLSIAELCGSVFPSEDVMGLTLHRDDEREHKFAFDCVMSQDIGQREVYVWT